MRPKGLLESIDFDALPDSLTAGVLASRAGLKYRNADHEQTRKFVNLALEQVERLIERGEPGTQSQVGVVDVLRDLLDLWGDADAARIAADYVRLIGLIERRSGLEAHLFAQALTDLAGLYRGLGRFDEAEPLIRRALAITERSFGPDHPDVIRDLKNLAQLLQVTNRRTEAEPLLQRARAIRDHTPEPNRAYPADG